MGGWMDGGVGGVVRGVTLVEARPMGAVEEASVAPCPEDNQHCFHDSFHLG